MIAIPDLQAADFGALTQAGSQLAAHVGAMQQQHGTAQQAAAQLRAGWEGDASTAATANADRTIEQHQRLTDAAARVQSVLFDGGTQLTAMRSGVLQNVDLLQRQGWDVAPDGTVSIHSGGPLDQLAQVSPVTEMQLQQLAATSSTELKQQLAQIEAQDQQLAQNLRDAIKDLPADVPPGPADVPNDEPKPEEPQENTDAPVPGPDEKPGDPGYQVPHAPGDPADYPSAPGWKSDAEGMINPPGFPPMPAGAQRDENWRKYLSGQNPDGTQRVPPGTPSQAYPLPEAVEDKGLKLVGAAENQQATRYVWGGGNKDGTTRSGIHDGGLADQRHDYEHNGFDCSGLSEYSIYQSTGYDPGHFTGTQYQNMLQSGHGTEVWTGTRLDTTNLKAGDIIYYDGGSGTPAGQHVAIYTGNGVTVETNESGTPVHAQSATPAMSGGNIHVVRPH